ncbi:MAG: class C sortase [Coriobacteriales bacterium]
MARGKEITAGKKNGGKKRKKSSRLLDVLLVLLFVFGLLVLLYPTLSNMYMQYMMGKSVASYDSQVSQMSKKDLQKEWKKVRAYNAKLAKTGINFFPSEEMHEEYEDALNPDDDTNGMMGHVQISKLGIDLPIYHGTSDDVLQVGVGHIEGTSLPGGGKSTHASLSGHRGLPTSELFTNLDQLQEGDVFLLHILDKTLAYQVDKISVVLPNESESLQIDQGKDQCTLITCTPYGINTHRLLVRGHRVDYPDKDYIAADAVGLDPLLVATLIAIPAFIAVMVGVLASRSRKRKAAKGRGKIEERSTS